MFVLKKIIFILKVFIFISSKFDIYPLFLLFIGRRHKDRPLSFLDRLYSLKRLETCRSTSQRSPQKGFSPLWVATPRFETLAFNLIKSKISQAKSMPFFPIFLDLEDERVLCNIDGEAKDSHMSESSDSTFGRYSEILFMSYLFLLASFCSIKKRILRDASQPDHIHEPHGEQVPLNHDQLRIEFCHFHWFYHLYTKEKPQNPYINFNKRFETLGFHDLGGEDQCSALPLLSPSRPCFLLLFVFGYTLLV